MAAGVSAKTAKAIVSIVLTTLVCAGASRVSGTQAGDEGDGAAMSMDTAVKSTTILTAEGALLAENDLVDVSSIALPKDALCCCNELSSVSTPFKLVVDKVMQKKITQQGRCFVGKVETSNAKRQCSKMKLPSWAQGAAMHKASTLGIPCKVNKDEVRGLLIEYDKRGDYCKNVQPHLEVAGASSGRLGSETIPQCAAGYKNIEEKMICEYSSVAEGAWHPAQNCQQDPAWCAGTLFQGYWEDVRLFDTVLNGVSNVQCQAGHVPNYEQVTCMGSHQFDPPPKCSPIQDYCSLDNLNGAQPWISPSMIGEAREVNCEVGYQASAQWVRCEGEPGDKKGHFAPPPSCIWAEDWCKGERVDRFSPQKGSTLGGALGESNMVYCIKGWEPDGAIETYCQADHTWSPEPKCKKQEGSQNPVN